MLSKNKKNTFCNPDTTCRQLSLDCILRHHKRYKRLLVGRMVTLSVGHNRPYDQPFPNVLINELESKYYAVISRRWKFMFKRIFRVSECADACICTKRAEEKSTVMIIFRLSERVDAYIHTPRARENQRS